MFVMKMRLNSKIDSKNYYKGKNLLQITHLTKKFSSAVVLDDINLSVANGDRVLITGQNGAGKTTLMKAILGQIVCDGEVLINSINPRKNRKKALSWLGFVPQTPPPLRLSVAELCEYCVKSSGVNSDDIKSNLAELEFAYENERNKPFYKLSGGMKQKVLIAIALSRDAQIIMFDEPTANLDPQARDRFLGLLNAKFKDKTLIFISHRLSEVKGLVNRVIQMDLGKIVSDKGIE